MEPAVESALRPGPEPPQTRALALAPPLARWLAEAHGEPTEAQRRTVPRLLAGEHLLLASPTGSGKTLAAFLAILSDLHARGPLEERTYCVYLSPLKALVNDMARNLKAPIEGAGLPFRVAIRTGDTTQSERAKQVRKPPHILVTTPESLALLLASPKARDALVGLRWIVVDEIHALAETKRGAQLALTLERLAAFAGEFQRVGLSATVRPIERVAAYLSGDRPVGMVEVTPRGAPELDVAMPVPDPLKLTTSQLDDAVLRYVEAEMARSRTLLVFTNTRASAERLTRKLRERHPPEEVEERSIDPEFGAAEPEELDLVLPHHGSMSKESRLLVEDRLKRAEVRCVVASSSLELGIHATQIERVLLLGSPKSAARTLQRMGRSGHTPGGTARATLLVNDPGELAEAYALQRLAAERRVEDVRIPENALDVLAQHVAACRLELSLSPDEAFDLTRRAYPYRDLPRDEFDTVRRDAPRVPRFVYLQNAGTIPESGLLKVFHYEMYVGEVEEEFASILQPGDVFLLAGTAWKHLRATPTRVIVQPARASSPTVPTWRGEGLSASPLVAQETLSELAERKKASHLSAFTQFVSRQQRAGGLPPFAEHFGDVGGRALVIHAGLTRRAHDALARALSARLIDARGFAADGGFALVGARSWRPTATALRKLLEEPIGPTLREAVAGTDLLKRRFRHVASRALVLTRSEGESLGLRQQRANGLLSRLPVSHYLVREATEECLRDALDLDAAEAWRAAVASGEIALRLVARPCASPLAARILAPPGEARHEYLCDADDIISYHDSKDIT